MPTPKIIRASRAAALAVAGFTALPLGAAQAQMSTPPVPEPAVAPSPVLSRLQVRALQRALRVPVDGVLGARTRSALRRAERRAGLPVDGVPDPAILQQLGVAPAAVPAPTTGPLAAAVAAARSAIGSTYEVGAVGPDAFDCSGLVSWSMKAAGIAVPRSSFAQYAAGAVVDRGAIQPGDLVFFDTAGPGASDVGIAATATTVISATTHGVMEHPIFDRYWGAHFVGARDPRPDASAAGDTSRVR